ncbi:hypothetical protein KP79_PYT13193 [Mizuhopecten yessoensis]|uniref:Ankyrin repeat and SOCS box protein 17 n=1 Tax=Mizuhopecten yessoensis TaxID=6573 RepID=A0A210QZ25_MIZYE|nr:hypothetical protein KP79_PYT13193 [Mizuhopecten yessoensis]
MGLVDLISRRSNHKSTSEVAAEKYILRCKPGKPLRSQKALFRLRSSITDVLRSHRTKRERECLCVEHHCLYSALRLCFENRDVLQCTATDLLNEILHCEGSLQPIFSILLPGHVIKSNVNINTHTLYPGFSSRILRKQATQAFEFYLHNICELKSLTKNGKRVIDTEFDNCDNFTPLIAACMRRDPSLIMLLLRYGADPFCVSSDEDSPVDPIDTLISGLNSVCLFKNSSVDVETRAALTAEESKGMHCLQLIFRAVKNIPFSQNKHFETQMEEEQVEKKKAYNLHPRLAVMIDTERFSGVRNLQHLCRLTIRERIGRTPTAIPSLPLPAVMKQYLDLQLD